MAEVIVNRAMRQRVGSGAPRQPSGLSHVLLAVGIFVLFLFLGAYQLSLPGLHYDEAKEAGLNAMQLLTGRPVTAFRGAVVALGPWRFPLMVQDYIGALNVYLAVPFLALGGVNVVALRWLPLLTGGLTLLLAWRVARLLGGPLAAPVAALLLAVHPTFVFWSRQGIFVTNLTALFLMASLWTGLRWWRRRRPMDLYLTALFWGLGLYAKLLFLWAIGAMVGVVLLSQVGRKLKGKPPVALSPRVACVALLLFALPLLPLLVFNVQTGGTLASLLNNLERSYYGVDNRAYLSNLIVRLGQVLPLLRGDHLWYLGGTFANPWAPYLAAGIVLLGIGVGLRTRRWAHLLPVALFFLIVAQSAFTVSDLFITHYALALPLVPLTAGLVVERVSHPETGRMRGILMALALLLVLLWVGGDLRTTLRYHQALARTGGHSAHSSAIYDLAAYLEENTAGPVVALDWGISAPVEFLTAGRVAPQEVFGYERLDEPDEGFPDRLRPFLENPHTLYVAHTPEDTVFRGRVEALEALAAERGSQMREVARIAERSFRPLFLIYKLEKPAQP
ncbi:MAG: glycosyltransferase family 39 protein [Anaerolineae bacterium]|nr:glycosyltransferase family 39 protein [Anaerolineae bacterium]MCX8067076.1 glycosyltransferase family 39 protein [Anaerolineae bacterium]MDW7990716.1 glycosyltransferase family 39 protein [Anaerolineae bacterium]